MRLFLKIFNSKNLQLEVVVKEMRFLFLRNLLIYKVS
nr:MAG TPA: hypothetical protein [Caudoviricetes sp.]